MAKTASGRKPPPVEYRFLKGKSGNPRGRPKGAISQRSIARRVALKKIRVSYNGKPVCQTLLECILDALKREAARGKPSMVAELVRISNKLSPSPEEQQGGFLLVPGPLTTEEWMAQAEKHNARAARDPSLPYEPNQEADATVSIFSKDQALVDAEIEKARNGLPSPLGEAIL
ncbi:MAG TPA: DUF5681 domain-containing protein, partial [Nitrobacter sp.]|nr:DUF5681 domain-containing protein [Nitrobacter sp.]